MGGRSASGRKGGGFVVTGSKPLDEREDVVRTPYERELMPFLAGRSQDDGFFDPRNQTNSASPARINAILRRLPVEKRLEKLRELLTDDRVNHEHGFLYDMEAGQIVSRIDLGTQTKVSTIQANQTYNMLPVSSRGNVVHIHNHPVNGDRRIGGTFSPADVEATISMAYDRRLLTGQRSVKSIALSNEGYYQMTYKMGGEQLQNAKRLSREASAYVQYSDRRGSYSTKKTSAKLKTGYEVAAKHHSRVWERNGLFDNGANYDAMFPWLRDTTKNIKNMKATPAKSIFFNKKGQYVQGTHRSTVRKYGRLEVDFIPSKDYKKLLKD